MGKIFKDYFLSSLVRAWEDNQLDFFGASQKYEDLDLLRELLIEVANKKWIVWCEAPIKGPKQIYDYLARYVHRPAMADSRIQQIEKGRVLFSYKDYQDLDKESKAKVKQTGLKIMDFISRFLQHVLPSGFQKVRYYGLLASSNQKTKLSTAKNLLAPGVQHTVRTIKQIIKHLVGRDIDQCERCASRQFVTSPILPNRKWIDYNIQWSAKRAPPWVKPQGGINTFL